MIQLYNTAIARSTNFPYSSVFPSRTQPGPPRHAVLVHGMQLPISYSSPVLFNHSVGFVIRQGYLRYHSAGFAIIRLASLSLGWLCNHSVGFAITRWAVLSLRWLRYHSVVLSISRLTPSSLSWLRYHSVGFAITRLAPLSLSWLRFHSVGFAITRLASLSLGWLGYRKNIWGHNFATFAFCEMNKKLFVPTLFPRLDTLGNLNNSP